MPHRYFPIRDAAMAVECADAVAAAALKKPGRPTFFETPAWSFSMG